MLIESRLLSDFFAELAAVVAACSHDLQPGGYFVPAPAIAHVHRAPTAFRHVWRERLCAFVGGWIAACAALPPGPADTWCYPLYQMGCFGVRQAELAATGTRAGEGRNGIVHI